MKKDPNSKNHDRQRCNECCSLTLKYANSFGLNSFLVISATLADVYHRHKLLLMRRLKTVSVIKRVSGLRQSLHYSYPSFFYPLARIWRLKPLIFWGVHSVIAAIMLRRSSGFCTRTLALPEIKMLSAVVVYISMKWVAAQLDWLLKVEKNRMPSKAAPVA